MIPKISGLEKSMISSKGLSGEIRTMLGSPSSKPDQVWSRITMFEERSMENDYDWIFRYGHEETGWRWISNPPDNWDLEEEDIQIISEYRDGSSIANLPYDYRIRLRKLQRGGALPDGTHLSWSEGDFFLDGCRVQVPFRGLLEILRRPPRGVSVEKIDWRMLLLTLDLANQRLRENVHSPGPLLSRTDVRPVIHPIHLLSENNHNIENSFRHSVPYNARTFSRSIWMERWKEDGVSFRIGGRRTTVPVSVIISKGRLQLRVRRAHGWRKIKIKSEPRLWGRIATWALSPPEHRDRVRLNCIQQNIFVDEDSPLVPEEEVRGIVFLRGIVDSSPRVSVEINRGSRRNKGVFLVTGSSGLSYKVLPGKGEGGTRFVVQSVDRLSHRDPGAPPWGWSSRPRICIVETPRMRRLSLGDAIGSVILTLLSDQESQRSVNTIAAHIALMSRDPPEPENSAANLLRNARMLRDRVNRNRALVEIGRCRDGFPRLWGAILRMPLGERVTFSAMGRDDTPNVIFDGTRTRFRTTSGNDRRVLYAMLRRAGWIRDREEEDLRERSRIYIRVGTGERDLVPATREICDLLREGLEMRFAEGEQQLRQLMPEQMETNFEQDNPGICALLPGTDGLIE